jgi:hypothetical protein
VHYVTNDGPILNTNGQPAVSAKISAPSTIVNLSVGDSTMGSSIAVSGVPLGGDLPVVDLEWTCQVDSGSPHFDMLAGEYSFIADLSDWGVEHRVLLHVNTTDKRLTVAPVGRYRDNVQFHYNAMGQFRGEIPALNTVVEGRITDGPGTTLRVNFGRIQFNGSDPFEVEVEGELLPAL